MNPKVRAWLVKEVLGGEDEEMLNTIYGEYLALLDGQIAQARVDLAAGDFEALNRTAHTLKGSTASVGDTEMFDAVIVMRDAAKAADAAAAAAAVAALDLLRAVR